MAASSSSSSSSTVSESCLITVQYEDTADRGLLVEVSTDDQCDPRFWCFKKTHGVPSKWKILFDDGDVMFLGHCPKADNGTLVDQDGDSHGYVLETVKAEVAIEGLQASTQKPNTSVANKLVESEVVVSLSSKSSDPQGNAKASRDFKSSSKASESDGVVVSESCSIGTGASKMSMEKPTGLSDIKSLEPEKKNDATGDITSRKSQVLIERAKTARSICRTCTEGIPRDGLRCGMEGYKGGHSVVFWSHAGCFLKSIFIEYCTARRGKCRGSGQEFQQGDVRVRFGIGDHTTWWLPSEAAKWTKQIVSADGVGLETVQGLEGLEADHREAVMNLLQSGRAPQCALRLTPVHKTSLRSARASQSAPKLPYLKNGAGGEQKDAKAGASDAVQTRGIAKRKRVITEFDEGDSNANESTSNLSTGGSDKQKDQSVAPSDLGSTLAKRQKTASNDGDSDSDLEVVALRN